MEAKSFDGDLRGMVGSGVELVVLNVYGRPAERIPITRAPVTIGRLITNDVVLSDPNVSRIHAELRRANGRWQLIDLGSTNGTLVNGELAREHTLRNGDHLSLGMTRLLFRQIGAGAVAMQRVGARTDVGRVRRINEDAYLAQGSLFVVADGMGGHSAGDIASSIAIESIAERAEEANGRDSDSLARILRRANSNIWDRAGSDLSCRGMGTTCTLLLIEDGRGFIAHVGDSRAYLYRDGELLQLTEDHTLANRLVQEGRLRPEQAELYSRSGIITRALGVHPVVEIDIVEIDLDLGDRALLCSDGLTSMIAAGDIAAVLSEGSDPQTGADRLVERANEAGGEDNVTVVVVDLVEGLRDRQ